MTKELKVKHWALTAALGLLLGACAHQEGTQSGGELGMEGAPSEETASIESSLGDASSEGGATSDDLAPLPAANPQSDHTLNSDVPPQTDSLVSSEIPPEERAAPTLATTSTEPTLVAPAQEAKQAPKEVVRKVAQKASRPLSLPTRPVERQGEQLNRFYIARSGDTAERVSELMYGNKAKATELKTWNTGSWKTGSLIFYSSPLQPADGEMRSFYQERGMVPTEYEVKHGDTLATIAMATYGTKDSWKEIGLLNGIQSPDSVEPGRRLALFPADLSGYSLKLENSKSASKTTPVDKQIDSLESQINKLEADIKKDMPKTAKPPQEAGLVGSKPLIDEPAAKDLAAIGRERQKARGHNSVGNDDEGESDLASAEVASFFKQHMATMFGVFAALAGIGVFFFIRRARNDSDI